MKKWLCVCVCVHEGPVLPDRHEEKRWRSEERQAREFAGSYASAGNYEERIRREFERLEKEDEDSDGRALQGSRVRWSW